HSGSFSGHRHGRGDAGAGGRRGARGCAAGSGAGIAVAVGVDDSALTLLARPAVSVLHADDTGEALALDVGEHVAVVDLAGGRLVAAGVVAYLEVGDFAVGAVDVGDQVALGD